MRIAVCGLLLLLGVAGAVDAQTAAVGQDAKQQDARPQSAEFLALQEADAAFRAGYAAMQAGKLDEARQRFADAVRLAPQIPEAHLALGAILSQLGRPEEAIPELEAALKLKP